MAAAPGDAARKAECPSCGAPITFRLGSSRGAVCSYCRFSVIRSDRGLSANGRVADLVPTAAPLALGDEGVAGGRSFRVLGRLQLDHGRGPWDEWYLGFGEGSWGWLARAEGRWYLTFARDAGAAPSWDALEPGTRLELAGTGSVPWVVTERGGSALLSAEGELPVAVDPRASGRYADLEGPEGAFATLDYGDESGPVLLYAGRELAPNELTIGQTALGPRPVERVEVERLSCPTCGAPVPLFVPSETERCGCAACGALLDHERGALRLLAQLEPPRILPLIALGSEGKLAGESKTLIGFMQRYVVVEGTRYDFREYLLHGASGYSWLVEENQHWTHLVPVSTAAVVVSGSKAVYEQRRYQLFARGTPTVDFVIGEFYWKVAQGDTSETEDYIAPPALLSVERTASEISWSHGTYIEPRQLERAFALRERLPTPVGVAPAQPNPHEKVNPAFVLGVLVLIWLFIATAYELRNHKELLVDSQLALDGTTEYVDGARVSTVFSQPFTITREPTVVHIALESALENRWLQVESALIPEAGGEPRELSLLLEYYYGRSNGESWSEGSNDADGYFSRVAAGKYTLRIRSSWEPTMPAPPLHVRATAGERSPACCLGTLALITLPFFLSRMRKLAFEQRRRENANV